MFRKESVDICYRDKKKLFKDHVSKSIIEVLEVLRVTRFGARIVPVHREALTIGGQCVLVVRFGSRRAIQSCRGLG
jgi:hypothetical protein